MYAIRSYYAKQFNDKSDFENYPVTIENDLDLLEKANCDIVFIPQSYNFV